MATRSLAGLSWARVKSTHHDFCARFPLAKVDGAERALPKVLDELRRLQASQ